jgi:thioredoxin reductase (NADPH)
VCTGQELTDALLKQIEPFGATFHLGQEVTVVKKQADGRFFVATSKGHELSHQDDFHRSRRGGVPAAHAQGGRSGRFEGSQLFYRVKQPADFAGKNLVIVGGGDSAIDWALDFAAEGPHKAESVILIHRRDGFKAAPANVARMRAMCDAYEMQFIIGQVTGYERRTGDSPASRSLAPTR